MSLLTSASVWTTEDNNPSKKRTPSIRKTIKRTDTYNEEPAEYVSQEEEYKKISNTIEKTNEAQESRNTHVNTLLNKITSVNAENAGNKLADFNPIVNPALTNRSPIVPTFPTYDDIDSLANPIQIEPAKIPRTTGENRLYQPQSGGLGNNYSSYKQIYEAPSHTRHINPSINVGGGGDAFNNKLLDKINYMIHMLEAQQNEKTSNITEEFILYTFLGVFIIFIVDSFSRAGKYIR